MNLVRAIMIRKERKRQRREGATRREKLSVSPLLWVNMIVALCFTEIN